MRSKVVAACLAFVLRQCAATPLNPAFGIDNSTSLEERGNCTPCGYYAQICCAEGEVCYTDQSNDQASCSASSGPAPTPGPSHGGGGGWVYWTSTFTRTDLITYYQTYSSYVGGPATTYNPPPQTTAQGVTCDSSIGQCACGPICCASWQYCLVEGQCAPKQTSVVQTTFESYTAPLRPTSQGMVTITTTINPTTTVGFQPAVTTGANVTIATDGGGGGLSGGAIAGIVIGVIAGVILLILLCLCLCAGAALDGILTFFGCRRRRDRRPTEEVEYYHRHGSRADGRTWYGGSGRPPPPKKRRGWGWGTIFAGGLFAFLAALCLGRRRRRDEKSDLSSSYYSSSYSSSSGRRTRDSRRGGSRR